MDKKNALELAAFYRKHLLEDVMPFWEERTKDEECGGYLTCFDRVGNVTDTTKYVWFQGRQLYMFPALYNHIEKRDTWLDLARWGRDFIVKHAYAGIGGAAPGRWFYQLDRQGHPQKGTISIYTDMFVLQGLCEYAVASGSTDDLVLIRETFDAIERSTLDPDFKDLFHGTWSPRFRRHSIFMSALNTAQVAGQVLGEQRVEALMDRCLKESLSVFAKDDHEALFESLGRDDTVVDDQEGRKLDPGHALEAMGFCLTEGRQRHDRATVDRAAQVADWMYRRGWDERYGGLVAYLDSSGKEPPQTAWHRETGMQWHDKNWWANAEALYTLAACAVETGNRTWWNRFLELHEWCWKHFSDPEYGEWYPELLRDGTPKLKDKGTLWKAAYHLPRSLMNTALLLEEV